LPNTSEPQPEQAEALITSLRGQPLLVVLRSDQPWSLRDPIGRLLQLGVRHIEIAWSDHQLWIEQCRELVAAFPAACFGAASITSVSALQAVGDAGLGFAVSPVLQDDLLSCARQLALTLVPGVMTPSEVALARNQGCRLVKLFPAVSVGPQYWARLAGPLGPLPFCIAAGGLAPADLPRWLAAGVDAVALGGSLTGPQAWADLQAWMATQRS
jgi:2-dehydro-3-deoxyphosphogluconate aldolase/(4S)-4-hydroxy-2-oxoglutarate aldolase